MQIIGILNVLEGKTPISKSKFRRFVMIAYKREKG